MYPHNTIFWKAFPRIACYLFFWFNQLLFLSLLFLNISDITHFVNSAKLLDIYRTRHNISATSGLNDPAVATGISDLVYESKSAPAESDALDDDLVTAWAANLGDDGLWGKNAPAMSRVRIISYLLLE